ncbi:hypothetical protein ACFV30_39615 [Streptomyces sp. NPDC059752]|uniref:hypothetical protein n=1 Tax=unclassified Streptomyces TaxID=2593676 RepID=UPI003650012C
MEGDGLGEGVRPGGVGGGAPLPQGPADVTVHPGRTVVCVTGDLDMGTWRGSTDVA